jgi:hypothetical protein
MRAIGCDLPPNVVENAMCRFFNSVNVARYRQLAGGEITASERSSILNALAEQWGTFMQECHVTNGAQKLRSPNREVETNEARL